MLVLDCLCLYIVCQNNVHGTQLIANKIYMQEPSATLAIEVVWFTNIYYSSYIWYGSNLGIRTLEWKVLEMRCSYSKLNIIDKQYSFKNTNTFLKYKNVFASMETIRYTLSIDQKWHKLEDTMPCFTENNIFNFLLTH